MKACNPASLPCVQIVLDYLTGLEGNGIILGQHTQTVRQEEIEHIFEQTGKLPALCGFELLAYSPNINKEEIDDPDCLREILENENSIEKAFEWAEKHALITFTWHWYSPIGGKNKAFYSKNTDFDARKAIIDGTPENIALLSDMDEIAKILLRFQEKNIPILWRPFHEAEGHWFWWGISGADTVKKMWRIMFDRYVNFHKLKNLIWVWNSPDKDFYPGDDVCDIISADIYPDAHVHTDQAENYNRLSKITPSKKLCTIGEIGTIPSVEMISQTRVPWLWFMIWSKEFVLSEEFTTFAELREAFNHPYAITLDKLPTLY